MPQRNDSLSRREFVKTSAVTTAGLSIMSAKTALGSSANSTMAIGIIGCGGRGNHDGGNFRQNTNSRIAALADPFQDRLDATKNRFSDDSPRTFEGLDAYEKLLATDVDAVIITSPPYFHPDHFEAAIEAKKHVYLEKPVAVDPHGAQRVEKAGRKAGKTLTAMVGFQTRFSQEMREAVKRIHDGAIGRIVCGNANYHSGTLGPHDRPGMSKQEVRLRNWLFDIVLSGDILVEQNIHVLDVCNWIMGAHPVKAFGTGGQTIRTAWGDTWDHYALTYWYPNNVELVFSSTQYLDQGWGDSGERFNGSEGVFTSIEGPPRIRGKQKWSAEGESADAEELKVKAFYESVASKKYVNEVAQGVQSTLTSILGRTAAYRKKEVTWKEMLEENERFEAKIEL